MVHDLLLFSQQSKWHWVYISLVRDEEKKKRIYRLTQTVLYPDQSKSSVAMNT